MLRVASGLTGQAIVLGIIFAGTVELFLALIVTSVILSAYEFFKIYGNGEIGRYGLTGVVLSPLIPVFIYFNNPNYSPILALLITAVMIFLSVKVLKGPSGKHSTLDWRVVLLGIVYTGGLMGNFVFLRNQVNGEWAVVFVLLTIWISDTAAYYTGRRFGKRKLAPKVSPGKTVEGAVGGLFGGILGAVISHFFFQELSFWSSLLAGIIVGVAGQVGDLAESLIKREHGVKDSGVMIPGHGGILDRIDSLLFAAPVFCFYLYLTRKGFGF